MPREQPRLILVIFRLGKVMLWVALDRGLRLADKRSLPCPNRQKWLATRDALYDEIQTKG
jgi:GH15 family glucan-1,4-alpha-glucosidase